MDTGSLVAGRYRLDLPIAAGGMGEVWRGYDLLLERPVAVKLLHRAHRQSREARDRFAREAKTLAGLRGPGLVEVYDYGEDPYLRTVRFIVMELVDGTSLATLIEERGTLTVEETLRFVGATAETLALAHRNGVVHRDIKPGNLLVESDGRLRVVDFGISQAEGDDRLTLVGDIMGTPSYIAPEQLSGGRVSGAADIYSLGVVAYECLSGRRPFIAADPRGVAHQHLHRRPPPLPESLPPAVTALVMRCLEKEPDARWPSAEALAAACRVAADATPVPGGTGPSSAPTVRLRRQLPWLAAVALTPVLVLAAVLAMWHPWTPVRADTELEADAATAESPSAPVTAGATLDAVSGAPSAESSELAEATTVPAADEGRPDPADPAGTTAALAAALPDVVGMDATEARAHLGSLGWTDVRVVPTLLFDGPAPEACEIVSQQPKPDTAVGYGDPVKIAYWGLHDCP